MCAKVDHCSASALTAIVKVQWQPICKTARMAVAEPHIINLAKLTAIHHVFDRYSRTKIFLEERYSKGYSIFFDRPFYIFAVLVGKSEHLFCEYIFARVGNFDNILCVIAGCRTNDNTLCVTVQKLVCSGKTRNGKFIFKNAKLVF